MSHVYTVSTLLAVFETMQERGELYVPSSLHTPLYLRKDGTRSIPARLISPSPQTPISATVSK